ncbi:FKBP-type peptidyl-prolyl cis-trans isomerase [Ralstonia pseudosolanacearum]|uniref:Peptidyl-prolyl cis-trans isomerase n=1 Tax=Ralstonia solanacearum TaxID=305 RepID=A0A0S4U4D6_RALSL|nr:MULTISPECIES: FKBP-type peptidyl-prolyl cis-trans isomerase [Ralstonia]ANH32901.1 peptidyl-prolyl cis-trans isomerase [Ralstonia solanacearum]APF86810.1 peptidylprolyl isomerase [Ralstonia solanacearum FJAT-1458]ARS56321.1 peptidylprolyl isomerase [Ralstonia solanacearum FJAT-91]ESS50069.1 FKBP-type peptidyl-prolyl cis-trans isomerase signal peptide protein [Ralstonia solanacearum SD54]AGH84300.1 FKBP-type peptidyl-prolyl cis-trans isomerase FkpA precursor [Ralstonia pseudosolanacearum FQY_
MKRLSLLLCATSLALAAYNVQAASAVSAAPAESLPSGVTIQHVAKGSGPSPKATDTVKVHYRGTLADGTEFDSSYKRGQPIAFPLNRVIPCWTEGVQKMQVGGKAKLMCPPTTAYGARGVPGTIPPNATLNFEVELLGIGG